jgi:AcrR family transcriptional regulator
MPQVSQATPTPGRSRRRGEALEHEATLDELADVGYGRLTMEGIAARAQTGKAALYRRWCSKHDLVHAALTFAVPPLAEPKRGRSARENLMAVFTAHRDVLAGKTAFPGLVIMGQLIHEPELRAIFADAIVEPRLRLIESILRAGVEAGELDKDSLAPLAARVGPALINQHFMMTGIPPSKRELGLVVETVLGRPSRAS